MSRVAQSLRAVSSGDAQGERRDLFAVQREQRWRVWLLFGLLLALVVVGVWVACLIVTLAVIPCGLAVGFGWLAAPAGAGAVLLFSVGAAVVYWFGAQVGAKGRLLRAMHCKPLDPDDRYHQRLANVIDELRLASGRRNIECVTVATLGLNAFAFSDLHGGGVVGVTEGALSRLSRQQLQAVVAHEVGHVLSGATVTATVSCLLFGVYSALGERLEDAIGVGVATELAPVAVVAAPLRAWLWVLELASSVTNAALSREREYEADLAAIGYTRDPLSLAEALQMISRHPGGAGYIPRGLAPLCIRDADEAAPWLLPGWRATHPPMSERIRRLLALAAVSPQQFVAQTDQAGERFAKREHWAPSPQADGAPALFADAEAGRPASAPAVATAAVPAASRPAHGLPAGASCPACGGSLAPVDYEGITILVCAGCGGRLVTSGQAGRILARREVGFTEEQQRLADLVVASGDQLRRMAWLERGRPGVALIPCPSCGASMLRRHYDYDNAVEVDRCIRCDLIWFEKDELEVLQLLAERRSTS